MHLLRPGDRVSSPLLRVALEASLITAEGTTQDFIMVNGAVFQAKTAKKLLGGLTMLAQTTDRLEGTKKVVSARLRGVRHVLDAVGVASRTVNALGGAPNGEPLGETCYSVMPFRYGDYLAKFSVKPVAVEMTGLTGKEIDVDGRKDAIREEVRKQMRGMDAVWEFRVRSVATSTGSRRRIQPWCGTRTRRRSSGSASCVRAHRTVGTRNASSS